MKFIYNGNSRKSGIYKIINIQNGRMYIGSAKEFKERAKEHFRSLKNNKHHNKFLQNDFNKCGKDAFEFHILEVVNGDKQVRNLKEEYWIYQYHDNQNKCYNIRKLVTAKERICWSFTPFETRKNISNARKKYNLQKHKDLCSIKIKEIINFKPSAHKRNYRKYKIFINANLLSPEGILYRNIANLQQFAEKVNLSETKVRDLVRGGLVSFKGWVRYYDYNNSDSKFNKSLRLEKSKYKVLSPNGELFEFDSIGKFAKEHGLERHSFGKLFSGRSLKYKGWQSYKE
jgi:group I intron endonuclease